MNKPQHLLILTHLIPLIPPIQFLHKHRTHTTLTATPYQVIQGMPLNMPTPTRPTMAHTPDMQPHTQAIHHTHLNPVIPHLLRSTVLVPLWPIYHRRHHLITRHRLLWQHLLHLHLRATIYQVTKI